MSYIGSEPARVHEERERVLDPALVPNGQRHDRISIEKQNSSPMAGAGGAVEISVTQRMISATWGSILTSLLGINSSNLWETCDTDVFIVTPLDVVRVRLQSQSPPPPQNFSRFQAYSTAFKKLPPDLGVSACCREVFWVSNTAEFCLVSGNGATPATTAVAECVAEEHQRKNYKSTFDGIRKIARNEGSLTLWRGLTPTLLMAIPANVIYFTGYDWLRYNDRSPIQKIANDTYAPLTAGSVARVAAAIAVSPIEMFRTRMQATSGISTGVFKDTFIGLHRMTQTQGYRSLWRGLTLTMWRDVPFSGFYWLGYESLRSGISDARQAARGHFKDLEVNAADARQRAYSNESRRTIFVDSFLAGAGSGAVSAFVTTPFDVGKTRQQVYRHSGDDSPSAASARAAAKAGKLVPEELSMPRFLLHILKEEGLGGLFKGWAPRCLKVAPACAIMISSYEVGKQWARSMNERRGDPDS